MVNKPGLQQKAANIVKVLDTREKIGDARLDKLLSKMLLFMFDSQLTLIDMVIRGYANLEKLKEKYDITDNVLYEVATDYNKSLIDELDEFVDKINLMNTGLRKHAKHIQTGSFPRSRNTSVETNMELRSQRWENISFINQQPNIKNSGLLQASKVSGSRKSVIKEGLSGRKVSENLLIPELKQSVIIEEESEEMK